ncbi:MAG TPA: aldo/keto reductase, partial [Candidatus Limnocylindrales bacterium]
TAGGRLIDTAAVYGHGGSESAIGAWLRSRGSRGDVVLLTKGAHPDERDWSSRMTPETIAADLGESLERLGVDSVDIYLVHRDDASVPVGEILDPLADAVSTGRAGSFGVSNWTVARLDEADAYATSRGWPPIAWCSNSLSLARPVDEPWPGVVDASDDGSRAWFGSHQTRLVAWSPTGNGYFAHEAHLSSPKFEAYRTPVNEARRARAIEFGAARGLSATQVALAWVMSQPFAPIAIIGTRSVAHLHEALGAEALRLTDRELAWLEHGGATVAASGDRQEATTWA